MIFKPGAGGTQPARGSHLLTDMALSLYAALAWMLTLLQTFSVPLPQFLLGVQELQSTGQIRSEFLPIGYPLLLAPLYATAPWWGDRGVHVLVGLLNTACAVATFACLRQWLTRFTAVAKATWIAFAIALLPELLRSLAVISDTALTALLVSGSLLALTRLAELPVASRAVAFGAVIGVGVLVRPNLALFLIAGLLPLLRQTWRSGMLLVACYTVAAAMVYATVTTAAHGRPFFPKNGPYNLFAGMNENAEWSLRSDFANGELSIVPSMINRGMHPAWNWYVQSVVDDARDLQYAPVYRKEAVAYAREHPREALTLTAYKFYNLFRPMRLRGATIKRNKWLLSIAVSRTIPLLWLVALTWDWMQGGSGPVTLVGALALLYVLPFVLTNSDPRFGTPVELLLCADLMRLVLGGEMRAGRGSYLTSLPRPAA